MLLWITFAGLTALAALAILRPYWQARPSSAASVQDLEVYKQQLREIEEEAERGLLGNAEVEAARIEVSRRILAASAEHAGTDALSAVQSSVLPYAMVGLLALFSLSLYLVHGSPNLPGQPLAARAPENGPSIEALVIRVEERLLANPEDGMGWSVIAPIYMRLGRFADAAKAYGNASRLQGETAELSSNLGEALTLANAGKVSTQARQAFEKALSLDPVHEKSSFWLGMAEEQDGRLAQATAIYRKMLENQPPDNVKAVVNQRIAILEGRPGIAATSKSSVEVDAAMIDQMVSGLAARLKQDGSDLNGWLKLVRAYTVLGRKEEALSALKDARDTFTGNGDALGQIDALAKSLGLPS